MAWDGNLLAGNLTGKRVSPIIEIQKVEQRGAIWKQNSMDLVKGAGQFHEA